MSYNELLQKIESVKKDLECATSQEELNYFGMELMILEDRLENTIARGRR